MYESKKALSSNYVCLVVRNNAAATKGRGSGNL